jgi:hypothetical protein
MRQQAGTAPKIVEPVTASFPAGAAPDTWTWFRPAGSLLRTVMAGNVPTAVGWKRIGRAIESPAAMISGQALTLGGMKSAEEEVTPNTERLQGPLLFGEDAADPVG